MVRGWSDPGVTRPVYGAEREERGQSTGFRLCSIYLYGAERERALDSALSEPVA